MSRPLKPAYRVPLVSAQMLEQANLGYRRFLAVASVALFVAIGYLAVNHSHAATGYVHVSGGAIYDGYGNKILLTGVDGGSWMTRGEGTTPSACGKTWSGDPAQAASIAAMGMNTERIAITWANVEPTAPTVNPDGSLTHHWDAAYLTALDGLIQADRAAGVMAIIDMHQASGWSPAFTAQDNCGGNGQPSWLYPNLPDTKAGINSAQCEFFTNKKDDPSIPELPQDGMAAAWKMLAARYDTNATVVGADLFNEPHKGCAGGDIAAMYEKVGAGVRAGSARMMLLYEDNAYESYMAQGFEMDRQPNLTNAVYSWHIYAHCWVATDCTTPGQQPMQDHLTRANSWGVPLWIGETDAMNATRAGTDLTDAEKPDLKLMMDYFKANDISWTLWGYDNGCCTVVYPSGSHTAKPALINFLQPYMQPWPLGTPTPTPPPTLGLHITGNHLVNEKGQSTRLFGINRSTANACVSSNSVFQGPADAASVAQLSNWNINAVRITMNEDCWLGINGAPAATSGANYRTAIQNYISLLHAQGYYAIIDLHFNAPGANLAVTQQDMADADHSLTYWTSVANAFKSDPGVIFEPYNEPDVNTSNSNATAPWTCWLHGCTVNRLYSDFYNQTYTASSWQSTGMQNIVDAIRATGATNVITLGGLGTSHDLSGLLANLPSDPLHQLAATFHNYQRAVVGGYGCDSTCWGNVIAPIAQQMPVLTDELGQSECQTNYSDFVTQYMNWADSHGVSYFPWGWFVYTGTTTGCTSDHQYDLLSNSNGTPNYYGQVFVNHFAQVNGGGSPSPTPTPPPTSPPPTPSPSPSCAPIVGNLNSDCVVNFTDLSILLTQWGTAGPSADLNHDGTVNLFDLSILLSHWTG